MRDIVQYTVGIQRMQSGEKNKQISPPKKFYLAEH